MLLLAHVLALISYGYTNTQQNSAMKAPPFFLELGILYSCVSQILPRIKYPTLAILTYSILDSL